MNQLFRRMLAILFLCLAVCVPALAREASAHSDAALTLSLDSGFYAYPTPLTITCENPDAKIYYTTDGSVPDETDTLYENMITLMWTTDKHDPMTQITGITADEAFVPQIDFPSAHIIRAVAILPDGSRSAVVSGTYFIGYDRQELYGDTAIMLLAIDPADLFDYETGIYVNGKYFDEWDSQQTEPYEAWAAQGNYSLRGDEWERDVTVTYLPADGEGFTQDMGVRIKGGVSRTNNQKSLRLIAREEYGQKNLKYDLFPGNLREADGEPVTKYKSFTLRNGGNDCNFGKIRDPYISRLAEGLRFETAANLPVVAFINGEYWGLYTLNEEYTDNYIDYHYGISNDNVITVKVGEVDDGEDEDIELFNEMFDYIADNDMSDPRKYEKASELLDMGSFADYAAVQLYISNEDGPFHSNNWQMWRVRKPGEDDSPYADGRWRMMLYDTDYSSGVYSGGGNYAEDNITPILTAGDYDWRHPTKLLQSLLRNDAFRGELIRAMCDVRNLYFSKTRAEALLDEMTQWYLPYQSDTLLRFGPAWTNWDPEGHFSGNLNSIRTFFTGRYSRFLGIVKKTFDLSSPATITVKLEGEGSVIINGRDEVPLTQTAYLQYFPEYGFTVTAVPADGSRFVGWKVTGTDSAVEDASAEMTDVTFTGSMTLTAVFE